MEERCITFIIILDSVQSIANLSLEWEGTFAVNIIKVVFAREDSRDKYLTRFFHDVWIGRESRDSPPRKLRRLRIG
jgi:hypothetical protein